MLAGALALSVRVIPTTLFVALGVTTACPSRLTDAPLGSAARVSVTQRGRMSRLTVVFRPPESVTVSQSRKKTLVASSPRTGTVNHPLVTPHKAPRNGTV